jgi:two-component system, NarL family, nitrate/nitrite response regulator NarL
MLRLGKDELGRASEVTRLSERLPSMSSKLDVPTYILGSDGLFRDGLQLILSGTSFHPHGCAIELEDLAKIPSDRPILFIVGARADQGAIYSKIRSEYPLAFIVVVADESDPGLLAKALDDGANAALFSSVSSNDFVSTLQAVTNGRLILIDARLWSQELQPRAEERPSPPLQNDIVLEVGDEPLALKQLSGRELAILERIVRGDSNKQVARYFEIAEPTVKAHVKAIFAKIGASNRTQAAIWALNRRLFDGVDSAAS